MLLLSSYMFRRCRHLQETYNTILLIHTEVNSLNKHTLGARGGAVG